MPIYEYECQKCGAVTDIRHGFKETNSEPCPSCGGPLTRRFNPAGIVFKGSGFYVTDSRKSGGATDGAASSESKSPPAEKKSDGGSKSETNAKPETKKSETAA